MYLVFNVFGWLFMLYMYMCTYYYDGLSMYWAADSYMYVHHMTCTTLCSLDVHVCTGTVYMYMYR